MSREHTNIKLRGLLEAYTGHQKTRQLIKDLTDGIPEIGSIMGDLKKLKDSNSVLMRRLIKLRTMLDNFNEDGNKGGASVNTLDTSSELADGFLLDAFADMAEASAQMTTAVSHLINGESKAKKLKKLFIDDAVSGRYQP